MCSAFVCPHRLYTFFFTRTASIASVSCVQIWRRRPGLGSVGSAQTSLERLFVKRCQIYVKSGKEGTPGREREGRQRGGRGAAACCGVGSGCDRSGCEGRAAMEEDRAAADQACCLAAQLLVMQVQRGNSTAMDRTANEMRWIGMQPRCGGGRQRPSVLASRRTGRR